MRTELREALDAYAVAATEAEALDALQWLGKVATADDNEAIISAMRAIEEDAAIELELARAELEAAKERANAFDAWIVETGADPATVTYGDFALATGRWTQEMIDAEARWRAGPHCPEDALYLAAEDAVPKYERGAFLLSDFLAEMTKRMTGAEWAGKDKEAEARRIASRFISL